MTSLDKLSYMLSKFNLSFTWRYQSDEELSTVLCDVFRLIDGEDERSLEQVLIGCVNQTRQTGLILVCPTDQPELPYKMMFIVHPPNEGFCITQIVIVSEARNLELYINDNYETSVRGIKLTVNKGTKSALYEATFDLSKYTDSISCATIKFLSLPCKSHMKIQAVIWKVEDCQVIANNGRDGPINLPSVKQFLGSIGRPLSEDAQKMLNSIENHQKSPAFKAQQLLNSHTALMQNIGNKTLVATEEEQKGESKIDSEEGEAFRDMIGKLGLNDSTTESSSSPQSRWAAYLKSRVRVGTLSQSELPPALLRSMSVDETLHRGHHGDWSSRQRPNSVGCVTSGEADKTINCDEPLEKNQSLRYDACGCHGCSLLYNSISTEMCGTEKRILEKMNARFDEVQEQLNKKFDKLFELLKEQR